MLCENCHQREATCHITTIVDDTMESRHWCVECHEGTSPAAAGLAQASSDSPCEYCGARPCVGGADFHAMLTGVSRLKSMCIPCSLEHIRHSQQQLHELLRAMELSKQERLVLIQSLAEEADRHMKQWVSARGPR